VTTLAFEVLDVLPETHAASPHLLFRLRVEESSGQVVHAIALRCQIRIEPQRRPYDLQQQPGAHQRAAGQLTAGPPPGHRVVSRAKAVLTVAAS